MDFVILKGRPITKEMVATLGAFFARINAERPIPFSLAQKLTDFGVELPPNTVRAVSTKAERATAIPPDPGVTQGV